MKPINIEKIEFSQEQKSQFKKMGIDIIYLFGSYAQENTHPLSDVDFGIVFENPKQYKDKTLDVYSQLYDIFVDILPKDYLKQRFQLGGHEFDIVFLQFAPLSLQFNAVNKGVAIYYSHPERLASYEEKVVLDYLDFKPAQKEFNKAILNYYAQKV